MRERKLGGVQIGPLPGQAHRDNRPLKMYLPGGQKALGSKDTDDGGREGRICERSPCPWRPAGLNKVTPGNFPKFMILLFSLLFHYFPTIVTG